MKKRNMILGITVLLATLAASPASAFVAPVSGDILYPVYDLLINKMISTGITYIVGFIGICVAAYFLMMQKVMPGLFCIIGGIIFLSAATITNAFGFVF